MLQNEVDKYSLQKYNHEEEILNILHDQKVASQTDKHASSLLSQLHNNCRKQVSNEEYKLVRETYIFTVYHYLRI